MKTEVKLHLSSVNVTYAGKCFLDVINQDYLDTSQCLQISCGFARLTIIQGLITEPWVVTFLQ